MKEVIALLNKYIKEKDVVVVGCSGGPDSMFLLNMLINYRKNVDISI